MGAESGRQAELAAELTEWWEDLWQARIGSQVVLAAVPVGWGRSTVLDRVTEGIEGRDDAPVTLTVRIEGQALAALETAGVQAQALVRALQVQVLRADLAEAAERHRVVERLGLDEPAGQAQLGLGVANLFFSGLTAGISFLLAGLAVAAAGKAWDDSPAGQDGALARTARAVAAASVDAPVTVIIDDVDCLDVDLAVTLVENLTARQGSQVLIVAVVDPGSALPGEIRSRVRHGLTSGLVYDAEADPDMGYDSRLELARQLRPNLPDAGARRIAQRTITFAEVFTVAAAPRLAEIGLDEDEDAVRAVVDAAVSGRLTRPAPSPEATVIAWAGGPVHARQADQALSILGATRSEGDPDVRRWGSLVRLADPAAPRLADQVATGLTGGQRREMAAAFLGEALALTADPEADLAEKVAALRTAHRVRQDLPGNLPTPGELVRAQAELVASLEALGDQADALQVATEALTGWPKGGQQHDRWDMLAAAVIRLSRVTPQAPPGPLAEQLIAEAVAGGAVAGLEARIWATIVLLGTPGEREAALNLALQVTADLDTRPGLGAAGERWRLMLAFHAGRAGLPDLTAPLLSPLLASGDPAREDAANVVLRAVDGPGADIRLQNILLEEELAALPAEAEDDRLRLHHALGANNAALGDYHHALPHARHELELSEHILGPGHPGTLTIRFDIANWTGRCGDPAAALDLLRDLLGDQEQILGAQDRRTLATRSYIANWTGESGDAAAAMALHRDLLHDQEQVFGLHDPDSLKTRANIAYWTGVWGDIYAALALYRDLLPEIEDAFGPRDPATLANRQNIARWTGACGDAPAAVDLFRDLLPDLEQVLGPQHPETLASRANLADFTGQAGDPAAALALHRDLLPDMEHVLGAQHPDTLIVRRHLAYWTGECGDAPAALDLYQNLLPDLEQVLGPRHANTLDARGNLARWTGVCGDAPAALDLYQNLLTDLEEVLGPQHPEILIVRSNIATLTGRSGDSDAALALHRDLLPDLEQVFGPRHANTLAGRGNIAAWTAICGDPATALALLRDLLPDQERILGPRHPNTLTTRASITQLEKAVPD